MTTDHIIDSLDLSMARALAFRLCGSSDSDMESAAMAGLLNAAQDYQPAKGAWVTFAVRRIRWAVLDQLRKPQFDPIDTDTLPDTALPVGIVLVGEAVQQLRDALELLDADELLDNVDMRRTKHRALIAELREVLA